MTSLLRPSFAQTGIIGKTGPWQMASAIRQSSDVCSGSKAEFWKCQRHVSCASSSERSAKNPKSFFQHCLSHLNQNKGQYKDQSVAHSGDS
jgi:hypothetical protein